MEKFKDNDAENLIHRLHDEKNFDTPWKEAEVSTEYTEVKKIYGLKEQVAFLEDLNAENRLWTRISARVRPKWNHQAWVKYAAVMVISFAIGSLLVFYTGIGSGGERIATVHSPVGQITSLTLFDGTTVWLNSGSTLKYNAGFNSGNREVFVDGEAFFDVTHNKRKPFVVNMGSSQIEVLGTKFNVKAYAGSGTVEAALVEGKIAFSTDFESVELQPSEQIVLSLDQMHIEKVRVDAEKVSAWKSGLYYYDNEKLITIIEQMQRWYDVEFVFDADSLEPFQFTGIIKREKTILYNMKLLELTNKIDVKYKNDKIYIGVKN